MEPLSSPSEKPRREISLRILGSVFRGLVLAVLMAACLAGISYVVVQWKLNLERKSFESRLAQVAGELRETARGPGPLPEQSLKDVENRLQGLEQAVVRIDERQAVFEQKLLEYVPGSPGDRGAVDGRDLEFLGLILQAATGLLQARIDLADHNTGMAVERLKEIELFLDRTMELQASGQKGLFSEARMVQLGRLRDQLHLAQTRLSLGEPGKSGPLELSWYETMDLLARSSGYSWAWTPGERLPEGEGAEE